MCRRINYISSGIMVILQDLIQPFKQSSSYFNESINISKTSPCVVLIRGIRSYFSVTQEIVSLAGFIDTSEDEELLQVVKLSSEEFVAIESTLGNKHIRN